MADEELQAASGAKDFFAGAVAIVQKGRQAAYATVNKAMIETYWQLGRHIVDFEQGGEKRADYGTETIGKLAVLLTEHFGRNFSARNLRYYRRFYQIFPDRQIWNACVPNLTWTHLRAGRLHYHALVHVPDGAGQGLRIRGKTAAYKNGCWQ